MTQMNRGKSYKLALSLYFDTSSSTLSHTISSVVICYNCHLFSCILCLISIYFSCKCRMTTTQPKCHFDLSQLMPQELQTWLDGWFTDPTSHYPPDKGPPSFPRPRGAHIFPRLEVTWPWEYFKVSENRVYVRVSECFFKIFFLNF